jgi:hypothetical protein
MQRNTVVRLTASLILALGFVAHADDRKVDPTGTWKWSYTGQNGQSRETTAKLKLDGDKLTGSVAGRGGDTDISDATLKGDEVAFTVVREFNGNKMTQKYHGKISGDTIKGKVERQRGDGDSQTSEWEAKREGAGAKEEAKPKGEAKPAPR